MTGEGLASVHLYDCPVVDGVQTAHFIMILCPLTDTVLQFCLKQFVLPDGI